MCLTAPAAPAVLAPLTPQDLPHGRVEHHLATAAKQIRAMAYDACQDECRVQMVLDHLRQAAQLLKLPDTATYIGICLDSPSPR